MPTTTFEHVCRRAAHARIEWQKRGGERHEPPPVVQITRAEMTAIERWLQQYGVPDPKGANERRIMGLRLVVQEEPRAACPDCGAASTLAELIACVTVGDFIECPKCHEGCRAVDWRAV